MDVGRSREVHEQLLAAEPLFHRLPAGSGRREIEALVAPEFVEIGASGREYTRDFVIDTVAQRYADGEDPDDEAWQLDNFRVQDVGGGVWLASYLLNFRGRSSRRTTLWKHTARGWCALHHQGTLLEDAELGVSPVNANSARASRHRGPAGPLLSPHGRTPSAT